MSNLYEQIGQKIRELRLANAGGPLSQEALSTKLSIAPNTVSRWETGTYKPTAEDLDALARLFNVPITVFFPDSTNSDKRVKALASAIGNLNDSDFEEIVRYAEFRKARQSLAGTKRPRSKG